MKYDDYGIGEILETKEKVELLLKKFANNAYMLKTGTESNYIMLSKERERYIKCVLGNKYIKQTLKWHMLEQCSKDFLNCLEKVLTTKALGDGQQRAIISNYVKEHFYHAYYLKDLKRTQEIQQEEEHQINVLSNLVFHKRIKQENLVNALDKIDDKDKFDLSAYYSLVSSNSEEQNCK